MKKIFTAIPVFLAAQIKKVASKRLSNTMKKQFALLAMAFSFLCQPCQSQVTRKNVDIAVENLAITNILDSKCGKDSVFISFAIKNKLNPTGAKASIVILINGLDETASFAVDPAFCYTFPRIQSVTINAKAAIKESWTSPATFILTVTANACNFEDGIIQFHETNTANNKQEVREPRLHNVVTEISICECGIVNGLIDTAAQYIIKGNIKLNTSGTTSVPGYLACANNLTPILSKENAVSIRFKFLGFGNPDNTIPLYNIVFALNGLVLTERNLLNTNNELTFAADEGLPEQKWRIRKNENGSYTFICISSIGRNCITLGRSANEAPTLQNPFLKPSLSSALPDKYQQFELIKLQ